MRIPRPLSAHYWAICCITVWLSAIHLVSYCNTPSVFFDRIRIEGTVHEKNGTTLPGVNIVIKGSVNGTTTDTEGKFALEALPNDLLVVSMIGYKTQEIPVNSRSFIEIILEGDLLGLDEVVVIGYGTAKRQDFAGSVSSLKLEDSPVALLPNTNILESLKGNMSGLNVGATNSAGGEPSMLIRGQNSISGTNSPLIVLDGVIYMGSLNDINPNDIASIDVLKDATSAASYGSRSANGVIAITTKRGRLGKPLVSFNTSTGFQLWQNRLKLMKGEEWLKIVNARSQYTEGSTNWMTSGELANREAGRETNWLDEITRRGIMQNYQAAVSGSTEKLNYYLSTSWDDNKAVIKGDQFNRISLLGKMKTSITEWLEIGADAGFSKRDYSGIAANLTQAQSMSPYGVLYRDNEGNLEKYPWAVSGVNPLWGVDDGLRDNQEIHLNYRLNTNVTINIPWIEGLDYRINYLTNLDRVQSKDFTYEGYYVQEGEGLDRYDPSRIQGFLTNANGSQLFSSTRSWVFDNILTYKKAIGLHNIDVTLVATRDRLTNEELTSFGSNFAANGNTVLGAQGLHKATVQRNDLNAYERTNIGYLGRFSYGFNKKYFLTGSYRRDGASVFGANKKWGDFLAAGVAWKISDESFLSGFRPLNALKLKLSGGQNGNQGIDPYGTLSTVANAASGGVRYQFSNAPGLINYGLYQSALGNSDLGWETTTSWNAGIESAWLNNRLFVDLDAYFSKTRDQIFTRNIPVMTGFKTIKTSMGQVNNTGIEATLRSINVQNKNLNWSTSLTFWHNSNKLVKLYGEDLDGDGKEDDDIANNLFIGHSLGAIYGYEWQGIVQENDTEYISRTGATPGSPKYNDIDGVEGITAGDRRILGYEKENFRLNLSNNLSYRNFDLYIIFTGIFGGNSRFLKSNQWAYMTSGTGRFNDNMTSKPYWTPENRSNVYPSAYFAGDGRFLGLQSRSYVRLQDISVSYTFTPSAIKPVGIHSLKIFLTAKNLATFTKWEGGDPETGSVVRSGTLPVLSTYSIGTNLSF